MNRPPTNPPAQGFKLPAPARRAMFCLLAAGLFYYAFDGLRRDDIILPVMGAKHLFNLHFHGLLAWLTAGAVLLAAAAVAIFVLQDLKTPPGQKIDHKLADIIAGVGIFIYVVLTILGLFGFAT